MRGSPLSLLMMQVALMPLGLVLNKCHWFS